MAKKVSAYIKLQVKAGSANPAPPVGPALGQQQCLGEALFLRAHYYYVLVRLYGGVPLRTEPYKPGTSTAIARNSEKEVYAQM